MLWVDPAIAVGVLRRLARYQATAEDPAATSSRARSCTRCAAGEMAALGEVPFGLYYGSVDATPLFVILAGAYAERTGDYVLIRELWPAIERALAWIDGPGDRDGDGFVEYARGAETGLANQGWKDSHDADLPRRRPRWPKAPIALVEAAGLRLCRQAPGGRLCARSSASPSAPRSSRPRRKHCAARFEEAFWCEDLGTYALALDGDKSALRGAHQQCRPRARHRHRAAGSRAPRGRQLMQPRSSPAGASAPSPRVRRATTRCPITTARSGRTTTR